MKKQNLMIKIMGVYLVWFAVMLLVATYFTNYFYRGIGFNWVLTFFFIPGIVFLGLYFKKIWLKILGLILMAYHLFNPFSMPANPMYAKGYFIAMVQGLAIGDIITFLLMLVAGITSFILLIYVLLSFRKKEPSKKLDAWLGGIFLLFALTISTGLVSYWIRGALQATEAIVDLILAAVYLLLFFLYFKKRDIIKFLKPDKFKIILAAVITLLLPAKAMGRIAPFNIIMSFYYLLGSIMYWANYHETLGASITYQIWSLIMNLIIWFFVSYVISCFISGFFRKR